MNNRPSQAPLPRFGFAPHRPFGTVYGVLLNHRLALEAMGDAAHEPPYGTPPRAPVLYIKPRNTLSRNGQAVEIPTDPGQVEVSAQLGIVIGAACTRVSPAEVLDRVAGYTIVNDLSLPHDNFYRPSVRLKARDGFCPVSDNVIARDRIADPDELEVKVLLDGELRQLTNTSQRLRTVANLVADVSAFMTLMPGDILTLGGSYGAPLAKAGQEIRIEIEGLGSLTTQLVEENGGAT